MEDLAQLIVLFNNGGDIVKVIEGRVEDFASHMGFDVEWGNGGGQLYKKGEPWPGRPQYAFSVTNFHDYKKTKAVIAT